MVRETHSTLTGPTGAEIAKPASAPRRSNSNSFMPAPIMRDKFASPVKQCEMPGSTLWLVMKNSTEQDYRERIVRTLVYLQQHLDDPLDLEQVAGVAAFSPFHFHRIFRGLVGETLREHTRRLRLERAAGCLKRNDRPVTEVALQAGFETHESFTRAFGDMFGVPPSAYRAAHKPAPDSASDTHYEDVERYHAPTYSELPPVEVKELPPVRMIFLRHVGPYDQVGADVGPVDVMGRHARPDGAGHEDDRNRSLTIRKSRRPARSVTTPAIAIDRPVQPEGDFGLLEFPRRQVRGDYTQRPLRRAGANL